MKTLIGRQYELTVLRGRQVHTDSYGTVRVFCTVIDTDSRTGTCRWAQVTLQVNGTHLHTYM